MRPQAMEIRRPPGRACGEPLGNVLSETEENGSFANSVTGAWGLGCTGGPGRSPRARNPLQYYCRSCTGAPGAGNATPVGICRAPNATLRPGNPTPLGIGQSLPDVSGALPGRFGCPNATSRTVSETFLDTTRRQLFLGVGGSGRSPLECTTFEIRAVAPAIAAFPFSSATRSHSGAVKSGPGRTRNRNGFRCRCQPAGFQL